VRALWWAANAVLLVAALPIVAEAARIIRSLTVVQGAAADIREAAAVMARELPSAVGAVEEAAALSGDRAAGLAS
jgi:hypothetical protein